MNITLNSKKSRVGMNSGFENRGRNWDKKKNFHVIGMFCYRSSEASISSLPSAGAVLPVTTITAALT